MVASSDGVRLAVHDFGGPPGSGAPTLVFTHATGFHGLVWRPVARELIDRYRCLAVDLRGHGWSEMPPSGRLSWTAMADDVVAVVDALGEGPAGRVHGIGHSMGGAALVMAAVRRPAGFRSLWLFDPAIVPGRRLSADVPNPLADGALRRREAFASLEAAVEHYARKPPLDALHPDALAAYVLGAFAQEEDRVVLRCRPSTEAAVFRGATGSSAWEALSEVHLPVAVVAGRVEPLSPAAFASRIADELGNGVLVERPDLGHFGPLEDPASVAADIAHWVSRHASA